MSCIVLTKLWSLVEYGGTGSFVVSIDNFEDFGDAIRDKLIKEITGLKIAAGKGSKAF